MIHQLRIYEIFEHNQAAFHARFRDHAMRIMLKYGFEIVAMWEVSNPQRTEFVDLLAWPDEEWQEIKRVISARYGDLVGSIEDRRLVLTDYSPLLPPGS